MVIAVTGANGFVGSAVLAELAERGMTAVPLVRRPAGLEREVVIGDLADGDLSAASLSGVQAVIHLAARTHVTDEQAADPLAEYRKTNVQGTARLLEAATAAGVSRFVFMSSVKAAGEHSPVGKPLRGQDKPNPEDHYGMSKLEAETLVQEHCGAQGMEWAIIRPPLVYGPGVKANFERLVKWVAKGIPMPFGAIRNRRSLVDVRNLADAAVLAATRKNAAGYIFMVSDTSVSTPELVKQIGRALGRPARLLPVPPVLLKLAGVATGRMAMVDRLCGTLETDPEDAIERLGWSPRVSFEESLSEIVADLTNREELIAKGVRK